VVKGQVFTQACFAPQGSGYHLASTLPEGKRAVSVALADYSVLEGLLYPGSTVDVIASFDMRSKGDNHTGVISKTLLHGIQVLAVENQTIVSKPGIEETAAGRGANENRRRVTLLVNPDQAEMLQLAMVHGVISLAMRKPNDKTESNDHITRLVDLGLPAELLEEEHSQVVTPAAAPVVAPAAGAAVSAPAALPPPPPPVTKVEERGNPMWNVTVLRGGNTSTQSFPVPDSAKAEHRK
jgi:pilus assembly protein CpaB